MEFDNNFFRNLLTGHAIGPVLGELTKPFTRDLLPDKRFYEIREKELEIKIEDLNLRIAQFKSGEEKFLIQIAENRKNLLTQLENARATIKYQDMLSRWPLKLSPVSILQESERRNSLALNLIVCIVDTNEPDFYKGGIGRSVNQTIDTINNISLPIMERAVKLFKEDMVCYRDVLKGSRLAGDSLCAALVGFLSNEPTILIEIRLPNSGFIGFQKANEEQIEFQITHWGMPFEQKNSFTRHSSKQIAIPAFPANIDHYNLQTSQDHNYQMLAMRRGLTIGMALNGLIVSIGDMFRTLQRPHSFSEPIFPAVLRDPTFGLLPAGTKAPEAMWRESISTYLHMYDSLATIDSFLASELAAMAALVAHQENQVDFANQLLCKAIQLNSRIASIVESEKVMDELRRIRSKGESLKLEHTLNQIRGWAIKKNPSEKNMFELARQWGA